MATYPNVPDAPGVPTLIRSPSAIVSAIGLLISDAIIIAKMFGPATWGLFKKDGTVALAADTVIAVEVRADAAIATAPQESGQFFSFNKVQTPFLVRLTFGVDGGNFFPVGGLPFGILPDIQVPNFSKGGFGIGDPANSRKTFLDQVEDLRQSLDLLDARTPEKTYVDVNVVHYDFRRTATNGATLLQCEVWVQQVRQTQTTQVSSGPPIPPGAAAETDGGSTNAEPVAPTANLPETPPSNTSPPPTEPSAGASVPRRSE